MNREAIYSSVLAFFSALTVGGTPAFQTATRKLAHWNDVGPEDQPALLLEQRSETAQYRKGLPIIWNFDIRLYLYVNTGAQQDPTQIPSIIINPLLDAIEQALIPDDLAMNACTLGGKVSHCAFNGPIEIFLGSLGDEAVAIIPINVLVPA